MGKQLLIKRRMVWDNEIIEATEEGLYDFQEIHHDFHRESFSSYHCCFADPKNYRCVARTIRQLRDPTGAVFPKRGLSGHASGIHWTVGRQLSVYLSYTEEPERTRQATHHGLFRCAD